MSITPWLVNVELTAKTGPSFQVVGGLGGAVARREALERGHPPYHEALLYAVHGTLHLLGHDDHAPRARARMRRAERSWLEALGLGDVFGGGEPGRGRRGT